jgi:hypothetical protein
MIWSPTHKVPAGGMAVWDYPDPSRPPVSTLAQDVAVMEEQRAGDWILARTQNGWRGWVDGRLLIAIPQPVAPQDQQSDVPMIIPASQFLGVAPAPQPGGPKGPRPRGPRPKPAGAEPK